MDHDPEYAHVVLERAALCMQSHFRGWRARKRMGRLGFRSKMFAAAAGGSTSGHSSRGVEAKELVREAASLANTAAFSFLRSRRRAFALRVCGCEQPRNPAAPATAPLSTWYLCAGRGGWVRPAVLGPADTRSAVPHAQGATSAFKLACPSAHAVLHLYSHRHHMHTDSGHFFGLGEGGKRNLRVLVSLMRLTPAPLCPPAQDKDKEPRIGAGVVARWKEKLKHPTVPGADASRARATPPATAPAGVGDAEHSGSAERRHS